MKNITVTMKALKSNNEQWNHWAFCSHNISMVMKKEDFEKIGSPEEITVVITATKLPKPKIQVPTVVSVEDQGIVSEGDNILFERSYICKMSDDSEFRFNFFDDEIFVSKSELVGKTERECWDLKCEKDRNYLQS